MAVAVSFYRRTASWLKKKGENEGGKEWRGGGWGLEG